MTNEKSIDSSVLKRRILDRLGDVERTLDNAYEEAVPERLLEARQTGQVAGEVTDDFYDDLKEFGLTGEELIKDVPKKDMKRLGEIIQKEIQKEQEFQLLRRREAARRNLER